MRATTPERGQMSALFHALSDETRLAIVERLRGGERCVCDLTDLLDAAQSRLSFHLKVLRDSGVVDCRREGRWAYYWLRPEAFTALDEAVAALKPSRAGLALAARQRAVCCD
ncbi:MAG: ArsR/SmtB family transcription factor [Gemmatimonadales bacterium]